MKIRMLTTKKGSPDGIQVIEYQAGQKYDMPDELAKVMLDNGWAEEDKVIELETKKGQTETKRGKRKGK